MKSTTSRKTSSNTISSDKRSGLVKDKLRHKPSTKREIYSNVHDEHKRSSSLSQVQLLPVNDGNVLLNLQHLHQHHNLATFVAGPTIPPVVQGTYPSTVSVGIPSTGLQPFMATSSALPTEKSGQVLEQLGSVLEQMKQESEGSAAAWRDKLAEMAQLSEKLAQTQEQLDVAILNERARSDELECAHKTLTNLEAQATQVSDRHREELSRLNDEVQLKEHCIKELCEKHEVALDKLQTQLQDTCASLEEKNRVQVDEFSSKFDKCQQTYDAKIEELCTQHASELQTLMQQVSKHEQAKQELGQHLWNVTKEVEAAMKREQEIQTQAQATQQDYSRLQEVAQLREKDLTMQNEVLEDLKKQVKDATAHADKERAQKNEVESRLVAEVSTFQAQLEQMGRQHAAAFAKREQQAEEERAKAIKSQEKTDLVVINAQDELRHVREDLHRLKAEKAHLEAQMAAKSDAVEVFKVQLQETEHCFEESKDRVQQLSNRCETAVNVTRQCIDLIKEARFGFFNSVNQNLSCDDPLAQLPSVFQALEQLKKKSDALEPLQLEISRLQHEKDSEREDFQKSEHQLRLQIEGLVQEVQVAREDAKTLAKEIAQLSQVAQDREARNVHSTEQLKQQIQELVHLRSESASQLLQLQKAFDSQRARSASLESEKRDFLVEAEQLNLSLEAQYRAVKDKQLELEQVRGLYRDLELRYEDLLEKYSDLEKSARQTSEQLACQLQKEKKAASENIQKMGELEKELESMTKIVKNNRDEVARARKAEQTLRLQNKEEISKALEDKSERVNELLASITQLQTKIEESEQAHAQDTEMFRQRCETFAQQVSDAHEAQVRAEETVAATMQLQQEVQTSAQIKMEQLRATFIPQLAELEAEKETQVAELRRVESELERVSRGKQSLQLELQRATDDTQDAIRAVEVARRDARVQAQQFKDELEGLRLELKAAHVEAQENATLSEELQTKMTTIQNAANATIDELVAELQGSQDALNLERMRAKKEKDGGASRAQVRELEDQIRLRDAEARTIREEASRVQDELEERVNEVELRLQRTADTLERKKQEVDAKTRDIEEVTRRAQDAERKITSLIAARDTFQAKTIELKQTLDAKVREGQDYEERARDEVLRAARERRALNVQLTELRDENEARQQQIVRLQRQEETMRQALERTKSELNRVATELRATTQRFENVQQSANQTIADASCRMQQIERTAARLQQELDLEREHRREAEGHRAELQRSLRHHVQLQSGVSGGDNQPHVKTLDKSLSLADQTSSSCEHRTLYANEPLTSAELSSLPMAIIKAQLGLERSQSNNSLPLKLSKGATKLKSQKEDGAISLLSHEDLLMSPEDEQNSVPNSPADANLSDRRSNFQLQESTSSRSSNDIHSPLSRGNGSSPDLSSSTSKSNCTDAASKKKTLKVSRSGALPITSYTTSSSRTKHQKSKDQDKILPRISSQ